MYRQIEYVLERYGYERITLNVAGIHLSFRQESGKGYCVVTLDETGGTVLSHDQFCHISYQIREFLQKRGCYYTYFLYLLLSDEDTSSRRLFQEQECFWRIVPSQGKLMVYETVDPGFMPLREPIERIVSSYEPAGTVAEPVAESRVGTRNIPWCNLIIIGINVLVFLVTDLFAANSNLVDLGAMGWREVFQDGQWYRVVTSMFLHGGLDHIFNNMLVLAYIGSCLEQQIGSVRYGILYMASGILAGITSMVYNMVQNDYVVSIGASGAIFGIMGATLFWVLFRRDRGTPFQLRQIIVMVVLSLYGGFTSQGVDNAAHMGGFLSGFLLALVFTLPYLNYRRKRNGG